MSEKTHWLDRTHPEYDALADKWEYTRLVYTGECYDQSRVKSFLRKRRQGEGDESYLDRLDNFDPELLFPMLIGSIAGQLHAVEDKIQRIVQDNGRTDGLGAWSEPGTVAGRLWQNADGAGMNYPVLWRRFTPKAIYYQTVWIYVDGIQTESDGVSERVVKDPTIHIIDPQAVDNWGMKAGRREWVKVRHVEIEGADSPEGEPKVVEKRTVYTIDGWTRYRKEKDANGREAWVQDIVNGEPAAGSYAFYEMPERRRRILPIYRVQLPFDQYLAHLLARKSVVLLNKESERDHLVRIGSLITRVDESSPLAFEEHRTQQREGDYTQNFDADSKLYFAAPPMDPAIENREIIKEKRENFFRTAYQQLNDQAAQATATQIRQEGRAGIHALLSLVSTTLDEAETMALFLIEQIVFPNNPDRWGQAYTIRSMDFQVADEDARDAMLREMYFGASPVPASADMLHAVAVYLYERKGFALSEEQKASLKATIDAHIAKRDGLRPRLAESAGRLNDLLTSFNGTGAPVN